MRKFLEEFKAFALRGNVIDMAIGVVVGGAFTAIVTAIKDNFIMPMIEVIMGNATTHKQTSKHSSRLLSVLSSTLLSQHLYCSVSLKQ